MKVLIIGSGGREHALAWCVARSPRVTAVFVAPGNAGTASEPRCSNVDIASDDIPSLLRFAIEHAVDLTIVGPEAPLVLGITDEFSAAGLRCFGPSREAAQLEGSKSFTKDFLARHDIPTAAYATFTRQDFDPQWVRRQPTPLVVKADGLASGKGVMICASHAEAIEAAEAMFEGRFGPAGERVVVEEFLEGEEASFIAMVDGQHVLPKVLEFNCRFGDPETQPILARMRSDLTGLCDAALDGRLAEVSVDWDPRAAVGVVLAAAGYPDSVRKGDVIHGLEDVATTAGKVFHAGTARRGDAVVTNGGRVLCAVGLGDTVGEAQRQAYALVNAICWDGMQFRRDIGHRAVAREGAAVQAQRQPST